MTMGASPKRSREGETRRTRKMKIKSQSPRVPVVWGPP
jgi:hypothetical protein